jgi:DNA primase
MLVEGELDALALISQGIPAITITAGASVWLDELSQDFAGKHVTVLMDAEK